MPGAEWCPGARLNYAENVMRKEAPGEVALYYHSETVPVTPMYWEEFGPAVRPFADLVKRYAPRITAGQKAEVHDRSPPKGHSQVHTG